VLARLKEFPQPACWRTRRTLQWIETHGAPAWTPLSGKLVLRTQAGESVLHAFDQPEGRDRLMLPVNAPSADVEGPIALTLESVAQGSLLVVEGHAGRKLLADARARGAAALFSASLEDYNTDKSGRERHLDAIQYQHAPADNTLPVGQISRRSLQAIRAALAADPAARLVSAQVRPRRAAARWSARSWADDQHGRGARGARAGAWSLRQRQRRRGSSGAARAPRGHRLGRISASTSLAASSGGSDAPELGAARAGRQAIVTAVVGDMTRESRGRPAPRYRAPARSSSLKACRPTRTPSGARARSRPRRRRPAASRWSRASR
jgi:hypothetical protein